MTSGSLPRDPSTGRAPRGRRRRPVVGADVHELLCCYREALELADHPPPSRRTPFTWLTNVLSRTRSTLGLKRMLVEHVRSRIELLDRRFCLRLALDEAQTNDVGDREQLHLFAESLPPRPSRLLTVLRLFGVIAISQVLLALLLRSREAPSASSGKPKLSETALERLTSVAELNPANFTSAVRTLLENPQVMGLAIALLTLATYLVWRPMLPAFYLKRMILDMPGAFARGHTGSELAARARNLAVHDEEIRLFGALGMPPPSDSALDLRIKAIPVVIVLALAAVTFTPPSDRDLGSLLIAVALLRALWLWRRWRTRGTHPDLVAQYASRDSG